MPLRIAFYSAVFGTALAVSAAVVSVADVLNATSAVGENGDHSLWFWEGIGGAGNTDFDFDPAGKLTLSDDGTMTLSGSTTAQWDPNAGFWIDFSYDSVFENNGTPFAPTFKGEYGSAEVAGQTFYRNLTGGTLTGTGILAGLVLSVSRLPETGPEATQIGPSNGTDFGANNKNTSYGLANWFKIAGITDNCRSLFCDGVTDDFAYLQDTQGDINVDLAPVPLPAGLMLLSTGVGGLVAARRRKG